MRNCGNQHGFCDGTSVCFAFVLFTPLPKQESRLDLVLDSLDASVVHSTYGASTPHYKYSLLHLVKR